MGRALILGAQGSLVGRGIRLLYHHFPGVESSQSVF